MSHKVSSCEVLVAGGGIIGAPAPVPRHMARAAVLICEPGPEPLRIGSVGGILGPAIERTDEALRALGLRAVTSTTPWNGLSETRASISGCGARASLPWAFEEPKRAATRSRANHASGLRCDWLEAADVAERSRDAPCLGRCSLRGRRRRRARADPRVARDAKRWAAALFRDTRESHQHNSRSCDRCRDPAGKIKGSRVIAAGAWSPRIEHLPRTLPVEPVRGQMALRRGRPTCRVRCCITTTATSWRAAAKRSSAHEWSTRVRRR